MKFLSALLPSLANLLTTFLGKLIAALGLTAVTYVGLDALISQFKSQIQAALNDVPQGMLQIFYLSGGGTVLNILFGCLTFFVAFKTVFKLMPKGAK